MLLSRDLGTPFAGPVTGSNTLLLLPDGLSMSEKKVQEPLYPSFKCTRPDLIGRDISFMCVSSKSPQLLSSGELTSLTSCPNPAD